MDGVKHSIPISSIDDLQTLNGVLHDGPIILDERRFNAEAGVAEFTVWVECPERGRRGRLRLFRRSVFRKALLRLHGVAGIEIRADAPIARPLIDRVDYDASAGVVCISCCEPTVIVVRADRLQGELLVFDETDDRIADVWTLGW
jgi:hypothetical protein